MSIKQFTIGVSRTMNLGNFESLRVEAAITWDLDPNDGNGIEMAKAKAQTQLRQLLEETYRNYEKKKSA